MESGTLRLSNPCAGRQLHERLEEVGAQLLSATATAERVRAAEEAAADYERAKLVRYPCLRTN